MTKRILYVVVALAMINFLLVPALGLAQTFSDTTLGLDQAGRSNLPRTSPFNIVNGIINVLLSLVGIISVIVIVIAGFKYLTSGGNDEKVGEARKLLMSGIIGLVLILAAYSITQFVIRQFVDKVFIPQ